MKVNGVNLNQYKKQNINFKRAWKEHQSWGVRVDEQNPTVKIFSYPNAQSVNIEIAKKDGKRATHELQKSPDGIFQAVLLPKTIENGDEYRFSIKNADGSINFVKDPYSFSQPTLLGTSKAYNQSDFKWNDDKWFSSKNHQKISRNAGNGNNHKSLSAAKIYEMHIATLTKEGTFEAAKSKLKEIKDTGFNTIEIMPVENTYSYNWGYDGVDKFAPAQYLGGADKLKELINEAHNIGLNVIMDMVPNHIGVDGSQLQKTGPYAGGSTPWGDAFNYEDENSRYVRDYIVNAVLNWIHNYHCDGLRLDMTKFMNSDTTMQQIAAEMNYHFPEAFLIAEDGRSNISVRGDDHWHDWWQPHDQRVIQPLKPEESGVGEDWLSHDQKIDNITHGGVTLSRLGFDSEWDFYFYHTLTKVAYGEADLDALERAIVDSSKRIKYSTSHDETGNMDGTRVVAKYMVPLLNLSEHTYLDFKDSERAEKYVAMKAKEGINISYEEALNIVKSQKVQQNSMRLAQLVQDGTIEKFSTRPRLPFEQAILSKMQISNLLPEKIISAFNEATRIYRSIEALKYFSPGPVMTFQGEEKLEMSKFNFFREFESIKNEDYLETQKGYPAGYSAFMQSKMGSFPINSEGEKRSKQFKLLIKDLNDFKEKNPSSTTGHIVVQNTVKHYKNPTIALHSVDEKSKDETFVVSNFSKEGYSNYEIEIPYGAWQEIINTDDTKYGGSGIYSNKLPICSSGSKKLKSIISLPAQSTVIFKRIG